MFNLEYSVEAFLRKKKSTLINVFAIISKADIYSAGIKLALDYTSHDHQQQF